MRILITGVDGFVGRHVARIAMERGHEVIGISRNFLSDGDSQYFNKHYAADLTKDWPVEEDFDAVLHLAGLAAVGDSFSHPLEFVSGNTAMMIQLGESLLRQNQKTQTRVIVVSTGAIYSPQRQCITENSQLGMSSPYVISKKAVENFAEYYRTRGLDLVVARPFNHIGPGQGTGFLVPDLYNRLLRAGSSGIKTGNLNTRRDYTDVRDVAIAYLLLLEASHLEHDLYNVASNKSWSGLEILNSLCKSLGIDLPEIQQNPNMRPLDQMSITGDATRLRDETGWTPNINIDDSIKDFVNSKAALK